MSRVHLKIELMMWFAVMVICLLCVILIWLPDSSAVTQVEYSCCRWSHEAYESTNLNCLCQPFPDQYRLSRILLLTICPQDVGKLVHLFMLNNA